AISPFVGLEARSRRLLVLKKAKLHKIGCSRPALAQSGGLFRCKLQVLNRRGKLNDPLASRQGLLVFSLPLKTLQCELICLQRLIAVTLLRELGEVGGLHWRGSGNLAELFIGD